jgi:hypothetical protein
MIIPVIPVVIPVVLPRFCVFRLINVLLWVQGQSEEATITAHWK